jgi:hypothetical protein
MNLEADFAQLTNDRDMGSAFHPYWFPEFVGLPRERPRPRRFRVSTDGHIEPILDNADSPQPLPDDSILTGWRRRSVSNGSLLAELESARRIRRRSFLYDELNNFPPFQVFADGKLSQRVGRLAKVPDSVMDLSRATGAFDPRFAGDLASALAVSPDGNGYAQRLMAATRCGSLRACLGRQCTHRSHSRWLQRSQSGSRWQSAE